MKLNLKQVETIHNAPVVFNLYRNVQDTNGSECAMTPDEFVAFISDKSDGVRFRRGMDLTEFTRLKLSQRAIGPLGGRNVDDATEMGYISYDIDKVSPEAMNTVLDAFRESGLTFVSYTTVSHTSDKCCFRVLMPLSKPISVGRRAAVSAGVWDSLGLDLGLLDPASLRKVQIMFTAHRRSVIISSVGETLNPSTYARDGKRVLAALSLDKPANEAVYTDTSAVDAYLRDELGLKPHGNGKFLVTCPNKNEHGEVDVPSSTVILTGGREIRFECSHSHCKELTKRQHLALHLCGVPEKFNVAKQPISKAGIKAAVAGIEDFDDFDLEEVYRAVTDNESSTCSLADLGDDDNSAVGKKEVESLSRVDSKPRSLVENMYSTQRVYALYGKSGAGKSTVMAYFTYCMMVGKAFFGHGKLRTRKSRVAYLSLEGSTEDIERNMKANHKAHKLGGADVQFLDRTEAAAIGDSSAELSKLRAFKQKYKGQFDVLIIDTLSAAAGSRDQNNAMQDLLNNFGLLAESMDIAVIFVHHSGKNDAAGMRGTSQIFGAVDGVLKFYTAAQYNDGRVNILVEKNRSTGIKQGTEFGVTSSQVKVVSDEDYQAVIDAQDDYFSGCIVADAVAYDLPISTAQFGYTFDDGISEPHEKDKQKAPDDDETTTEKKVIAILEDNPEGVALNDIADALKLDPRTIKSSLLTLPGHNAAEPNYRNVEVYKGPHSKVMWRLKSDSDADIEDEE